VPSLRGGLSLLLLLWSGLTLAQTYPTKPVRIIVAVGPGGGDDFTARQVAAKLSELVGQQFIVENRPGAGGMIGQTYVAKSAPDGYTLLLAGGSMAGAHYVNANMGYNLMRDFTPISLLEQSPFALVANPALPARNLKELISHGRSRPGQLTFATLGAGQIPYWGVVLFNSMAGIQAVEVQYKAPADAMLDIIAGRVDYFVAPVVTALGQRDKMRTLGVTTTARADMLPDVPTIAEGGLPGYDMPAWRSLMGPAGIPADVVQTLNRAVVRALQAPELRERFAKAGSVAMSSTPEELRARYQHWMAIFGTIAKDAKLQPQ
jgi:tripartite-type tricarboxylate transporter receptor subunit TctC